jgi:xanthine dehydrogenase accessory factor
MTPLSDRLAALIDQRRPFVQATVVRAQCPTSARPGDRAIITPDGTLEGFVGGHCAEGSVRTAALTVLETGSPLLLRILPEHGEEFPESPGAETVVNPCLSGGALEVYLEPMLPAPEVFVVGKTPIADALIRLGHPLGLSMRHAPAGPGDPVGASAVIVASHGRAEEESVRAALDRGVGYVGVVASHTRGAALLAELDLGPEEAAVVHTPVGIDIGATTAEEIALSILADVVRAIRVDGLSAPKTDESTRPITAIDPVCGMTVTVVDDTPHLRHEGVDHWFCNPGCRDRHADELAAAG